MEWLSEVTTSIAGILTGRDSDDGGGRQGEEPPTSPFEAPRGVEPLAGASGNSSIAFNASGSVGGLGSGSGNLGRWVNGGGHDFGRAESGASNAFSRATSASSVASSRAAALSEMSKLGIHERCEMLAAINSALVQHIYRSVVPPSSPLPEAEDSADSEGGEPDVEPRTELEGDWWAIEGWHDAPASKATASCVGHDVHVSRNAGLGASMQMVVVDGEAKFICVEDCSGMQLNVELATMAILVLGCSRCVIVVGGSVPGVTLRDCVNVEIIAGERSITGGIETVGCHGVTVTTVPQGSHPFLTTSQLQASDQKNSMPVPERLTTAIINGNIFTTCAGSKSQVNNGHMTMAHIR